MSLSVDTLRINENLPIGSQMVSHRDSTLSRKWKRLRKRLVVLASGTMKVMVQALYREIVLSPYVLRRFTRDVLNSKTHA